MTVHAQSEQLKKEIIAAIRSPVATIIPANVRGLIGRMAILLEEMAEEIENLKSSKGA